MAKKLTPFEQAQAAAMLLALSQPAANAGRSLGAGHGTAGASDGLLLNQNAANPRYGQRYQAIAQNGRILHRYADGTVIDMGPLVKGRPAPNEATSTYTGPASALNALDAHPTIERHLMSDPSGGQNVSLGQQHVPTLDLNAVYYPKGNSTRPRITRQGEVHPYRRGSLRAPGTRYT